MPTIPAIADSGTPARLPRKPSAMAGKPKVRPYGKYNTAQTHGCRTPGAAAAEAVMAEKILWVSRCAIVDRRHGGPPRLHLVPTRGNTMHRRGRALFLALAVALLAVSAPARAQMPAYMHPLASLH